jgi:L-rhamnose isomerase
VLGIRSTIKSLLIALLEPSAQINAAEKRGDYLSRLALMEETKFHPVGAVWDYYCKINNTPTEADWLQEAIDYENNVLSKRV